LISDASEAKYHLTTAAVLRTPYVDEDYAQAKTSPSSFSGFSFLGLFFSSGCHCFCFSL